MKVDTSKSVFYERYKPQCVNDLVLPEPVKSAFTQYVQSQKLPHLGLFSSTPGSGKSSTAHSIIKDLGGEAMWINASMEKGIDTLRGKIGRFASQTSFDGRIKVVVMDEADYLTADAQAAFRGFLDTYSKNCRFIFTGNYTDKIIQPLLDRLEVYDYNSFDRDVMVKPIFERLQFILNNEGIKYEPRDIVPVIKTFYPSIRSMVGALQKFSKDGEFKAQESDLDDVNVFDSIMSVARMETYNDMIIAVNKLSAPDNFYTYIYQNAGKYFNPDKYANVVVTVAKYQEWSGNVRNKNLNLAACLTEIMGLRK